MAERFTVLTPELASAMLDVVQRRNRYPRGTPFLCTVLEAALYGAADFTPKPPRREFFAALKRPNWKHDRGSRG